MRNALSAVQHLPWQKVITPAIVLLLSVYCELSFSSRPVRAFYLFMTIYSCWWLYFGFQAHRDEQRALAQRTLADAKETPPKSQSQA